MPDLHHLSANHDLTVDFVRINPYMRVIAAHGFLAATGQGTYQDLLAAFAGPMLRSIAAASRPFPQSGMRDCAPRPVSSQISAPQSIPLL
jgi:hypothetical protein